jgi:hypothetical protein
MNGVKVTTENEPTPQIDVQATKEEIHKMMTKWIIETLGGWVGEATNPIPVWSGASRATFLKAANEAKTTISISPIVAPIGSRIDLGIEESTFILDVLPAQFYGWEWTASLDYLPVVDDRVRFLARGEQYIKTKETPPEPPIVMKKDK